VQITKIRGLRIYFDEEEKDSADQLIMACEQSLEAISDTWQLPVPEDCRVYLLASWPRCVFLGAPLGSQILLGLTLPLWYRDFHTRWQYAGGWSQRYGTRQVVGIKAPHLIGETKDAIGESIFVTLVDPDQKYLSIVCHELTHACTAVLNLPAWLNEGLAMVTVDRCLGQGTVLPESLDLLGNQEDGDEPAERLNMKTQSREAIILLYVRGYWLTRYLEETQVELLENILEGKYAADEIEARVSGELAVSPRSFWREADLLLLNTITIKFYKSGNPVSGLSSG
jgi:hypothetical protein